MKSMNVKKLAALGAAFAVAFAPVAHAAMHAENLPTDRNWYLNSTIVVGTGVDSPAKVEDVVAAAEISAAIAQLAFEKAEVTAEATEKKVELSVPGEVVVGGQGYTDDSNVDLSAGTWDFDKVYGPTKVTTLLDNADFSFKYKQTSASEWKDGDGKAKEELGVKLDVVADQVTDTDNAEIRAKTEAGGMKYTLTLSGVVGDEFASGNVYDVQNMYLSILGDKYEVTKVDMNADQITMVSSQEVKTVEVGGTVDFEGYTIKVADIDPDNQTAYLVLLDDQGNEVASDVVAAGDYTDFDGKLSDSIKVDTVFAGTEKKFAKLELKADEITLDKGVEKELDKYPGWYIKWDYDTDNMYFYVYYNGDEDDSYLTFDTGLKVGDTFKYAGSAGYGVSFLGFESKIMKEVKFDGGKVYFIDADGASHEGLLFKEISDASITDGTNAASATVYDFMDGEKAKIEVSVSDFKDYASGSTQYLTADFAVKVDLGADDDYELQGTVNDYQLDTNTTSPVDHVVVPVTATDGSYKYAVYIQFDTSSLNANGASDDSISDFKLIRVAFADNGVSTTSEDTPYKVKADVNSVTGIPADWNVTDIGGYVITVPFDGADKELDFENFQVDVAGTKVDAKADNSYPENFWTNAGTEVYVKDSDTLEIKVPIDERKVKIFVGIPQEVKEGENVIEAGEGESVKIGDYEVKIEKIIAGGVTAEGDYYEKVASVDPTAIVRLDSEVGNTGNLIVVGGWYVNQIAKAIAEANPEIKEEVQKEGDFIVNKYDYNGQEAIVVFGWTAADTRKAAREFIKFLQENVQ